MSLTLKLVLTPLLLAQAVATRKRMPRLPEADGERSGEVGDGPPLRLLVTGDSSAAGVGVVTQRQALAYQLAERLAQVCSARVVWRLLARTGLNTAQTLDYLRREAPPPADVAVVVTGVNDIIDQVPARRAVRARDEIVAHLRHAQGVRHVVFAPVPPIQHLPGLPQPLRWISGTDARRHNAALRRWAGPREDASTVEMPLVLHRGVLAEDGFHPGEPIYRDCARLLAEHIAARAWPLPAAKANPG
jgi:lysophospholipase L1-like esterase